MTDYLMIGTVLKPQGIRGECKIRSWAADINLFDTWSELYLKTSDGFQPVRLQVTTLIADLIGCTARDEEGNEIGVLTDVLQYGTVDTWVFKTKTGSLMAPALLSVFPTVDIVNKAIRVTRENLEEVAVRS